MTKWPRRSGWSRWKSTARASARCTRRPSRPSSMRARARRVFLVAQTYRLSATTSATRRSPAEGDLRAFARPEDPIDKLRAELDLSDDEFEELDKEVTELVEASVEFAKSGTDPNRKTPSRTSTPSTSLSYREAVRDALATAMRKDDDVFIMGEDIAESGGSMGVTQGCWTSSARANRNTPISRSASSAPGSARRCKGCDQSSRSSCTRTSDALGRADRQPGGQAPVHVGRTAEGAADDRTQGGAGRPGPSTRSSSRRGSSTSRA